jgi:hypothetical protein
VVNLEPSDLSFPNPFPFKLAIYRAEVQNFGMVRDGPASLSLWVDRLNRTCPAAFVIPFSPYRLTLKPGHHTERVWLVLFLHCGDPSGPVDYIATARVSAPGDSNPANDSLTATVDVLKRHPWWWW